VILKSLALLARGVQHKGRGRGLPACMYVNGAIVPMVYVHVKEITMSTVKCDRFCVDALVALVDELPRKEGTTRYGTPYAGLFAKDVATAFYAVLNDIDHPMKAKNEACSYDRPCGKCRRCALQAASDTAETEGKIVKQIASKSGTDARGRKTRNTWTMYYRPGEATGRAAMPTGLLEKIRLMRK